MLYLINDFALNVIEDLAQFVLNKAIMKYLFIALMMFSFSAQASILSWKDPKFDITLTFPDDWMRQAQEGNDLRLHILAPQGQDHAACRVMANNDNRFLYVPPQGAIQVTQFVQDQDALRGILANRLRYDNVRLIGYQSLGGLGKGPATIAIGQFTKSWNGQNIPMQSIVFGGYTHGLETIFQCESMAQSWTRWYPTFMTMASTFDFPAKGSSFKHGQYRDFMADGFVYFPFGTGNAKGLARY
jgi:hypothetical protein